MVRFTSALSGHSSLGVDTFGEHQVQLHFDERVRLSVESGYRIELNGRREFYEEIRDGAADVVALISMTVTRAYRVDEKTVRFEFGDGEAFEAIDDSTQYESFQIWNVDVITVV